MAKIINGTDLSKTMRAEMAEEVRHLKAEHNLTPGLAVVLVGDDPASISYIKGKRKACADIGLYSIEHTLTADQPESDLLGTIEQLNDDPAIHGILVQLPLPTGFDEQTALNSISPDKDVDGLHPVNLGRLMRGEEGFLPCTPHGVQQILKRGNFEVAGKHVVIVGRSTLVGRPLANILSQKASNATVTLCHTGTRDLGHFTRQADILIVVTGHPNTVTADMVRDNAVVIDIGVNRVPHKSKKSGLSPRRRCRLHSHQQKSTRHHTRPGRRWPHDHHHAPVQHHHICQTHARPRIKPSHSDTKKPPIATQQSAVSKNLMDRGFNHAAMTMGDPWVRVELA